MIAFKSHIYFMALGMLLCLAFAPYAMAQDLSAGDEPASITTDVEPAPAAPADETPDSVSPEVMNIFDTPTTVDEQPPAEPAPQTGAQNPGMTLTVEQTEQIVQDLEEAQAAREEKIREEAFKAAIGGILPMEPEEIKKLIREYEKVQKAVEDPVKPRPKPEVSVQTVSLDPGATPITVKVAPGHVTTLNILDTTGAPWPIQDLTWAGNFNVVEPGEGGHILRITPLSENAFGNVSMRLLDLKTPVTFTMASNEESVQYRLDIRIPEFGPLAEPALIDGGLDIVAGSPDLTAVLDGTPPPGSVKLNVSGVDGRTTAYVYNGMTYVRTPLTLLSPGWNSSVKSADGMNVYSLNDTPVLILSEKGKLVRAYLSEKETLDVGAAQ